MTLKRLKILTAIVAPILITSMILSVNRNFMNNVCQKYVESVDKYVYHNTKKPTTKIVTKEEILLLPDSIVVNYYEDEYKVVVGSFKIKENAFQSVKLLTEKGYDARFTHSKDSMYRVAIGSFDDNRKALKLVEETRNKGMLVWIEK